MVLEIQIFEGLLSCFYVCVWYSFVHVVRSGELVPWTTHIKHKVVSSLIKVCPSRSSVHHFLALISTKQGVNVTCSRTLRKAHRAGVEPGTLWSEIRHPNHCPTMHLKYSMYECGGHLGHVTQKLTYKIELKRPSCSEKASINFHMSITLRQCQK